MNIDFNSRAFYSSMVRFSQELLVKPKFIFYNIPIESLQLKETTHHSKFNVQKNL